MSDLSSLANTSVVNYVSFCLIFFVLKYRYFAEDKYMWIGVFFIVACILQFINNMYLSSLPSFCGEVQMNLALYATLMPWIIIFGSFALSLLVFPGWLRAFSNTFGAKAAQMFGIDNVISAIFTDEGKKSAAAAAQSENPVNINLLKAIDSIYTGKTVFINELNPDDVMFRPLLKDDGTPELDENQKQKREIVWGSLMSLVPSIIKEVSQKNMLDLYHNILLKDTVGYFIWYLLVGSLTVLVSTNTLLNSGCSTQSGDYNAIFNS